MGSDTFLGPQQWHRIRWKGCLTPLFAGVAVALAVPGDAAERGAPIPDFSGVWAHFTWPDVEPPRTGAGPITNRSRRDGVSNGNQLVGDYDNPVLKPDAA